VHKRISGVTSTADVEPTAARCIRKAARQRVTGAARTLITAPLKQRHQLKITFRLARRPERNLRKHLASMILRGEREPIEYAEDVIMARLTQARNRASKGH
jgi:hypothetical protein